MLLEWILELGGDWRLYLILTVVGILCIISSIVKRNACLLVYEWISFGDIQPYYWLSGSGHQIQKSLSNIDCLVILIYLKYFIALTLDYQTITIKYSERKVCNKRSPSPAAHCSVRAFIYVVLCIPSQLIWLQPQDQWSTFSWWWSWCAVLLRVIRLSRSLSIMMTTAPPLDKTRWEAGYWIDWIIV